MPAEEGQALLSTYNIALPGLQINDLSLQQLDHLLASLIRACLLIICTTRLAAALLPDDGMHDNILMRKMIRTWHDSVPCLLHRMNGHGVLSSLLSMSPGVGN